MKTILLAAAAVIAMPALAQTQSGTRACPTAATPATPADQRHHVAARTGDPAGRCEYATTDDHADDDTHRRADDRRTTVVCPSRAV